MNTDVIITCPVTGGGDTADKHPDLPITPEQIATAAIDAAKAGAAIVHIHARDPREHIRSQPACPIPGNGSTQPKAPMAVSTPGATTRTRANIRS